MVEKKKFFRAPQFSSIFQPLVQLKGYAQPLGPLLVEALQPENPPFGLKLWLWDISVNDVMLFAENVF